MQDPANQAISSFPLPPAHYFKFYSNDNVAKNIAPKPPNVGLIESYSMFGWVFLLQVVFKEKVSICDTPWKSQHRKNTSNNNHKTFIIPFASQQYVHKRRHNYTTPRESTDSSTLSAALWQEKRAEKAQSLFVGQLSRSGRYSHKCARVAASDGENWWSDNSVSAHTSSAQRVSAPSGEGNAQGHAGAAKKAETWDGKKVR